MFFKGKDVVVWGGGGSALSYTNYLQSIGCKVTLVHRRDEFRAEKSEVEKAKKAGVKFVLNTSVKSINGKKFVESVTLEDGTTIKCSAIFVAIGEVPAVELFKKAGVAVDKNSFIITKPDQSTNMDGIYAAGDVTTTQLRQIATAVGDGAKAAFSAYNYVQGMKK
jgi:thioredoxin reductase (NADPH)